VTAVRRSYTLQRRAAFILHRKKDDDMGKKPDDKTVPGTTAPENVTEKPETRVNRTFKNTYIGTYGIFIAGKSYPLAREQYEALAEDLE
jgi:hypothetical protein